MNFDVESPVIRSEDIDRAILGIANDEHRDDFRDISELMIRTGLDQKGAKEKLFNKVSECVLKKITKGVVQITVQELEAGTEIKAKMVRTLPEFFLRIDFDFKSGTINLQTLTYWFKVASNITLDNLAVVVKKEEIAGIRSGNLQAFVTLEFYGHDKENKSPFTLFKDKKIVDIDLEKAVKFGGPKAS